MKAQRPSGPSIVKMAADTSSTRRFARQRPKVLWDKAQRFCSHSTGQASYRGNDGITAARLRAISTWSSVRKCWKSQRWEGRWELQKTVICRTFSKQCKGNVNRWFFTKINTRTQSNTNTELFSSVMRNRSLTYGKYLRPSLMTYQTCCL